MTPCVGAESHHVRGEFVPDIPGKPFPLISKGDLSVILPPLYCFELIATLFFVLCGTQRCQRVCKCELREIGCGPSRNQVQQKYFQTSFVFALSKNIEPSVQPFGQWLFGLVV